MAASIDRAVTYKLQAATDDSDVSQFDPDSDIDFTPDQWDDSELYPWDCDQGVPW